MAVVFPKGKNPSLSANETVTARGVNYPTTVGGGNNNKFVLDLFVDEE